MATVDSGDICPICSFKNLALPGLSINPRIPQILVSNAPLSSTDTEIVEAGLEELAQERVRLKELMKATQAALNDLEKTLGCVKAAITMHKGCSSPIRLLPDDVLLFIFELRTFARRRSFEKKVNPLNTLAWPPWVLSQVCRRWRTLAVSDSKMWCVIHELRLWEKPGRLLDLQLEAILRRARPRYITVNGDTVSHRTPPSIIALLRDAQHDIGYLSALSLSPFKGFSFVNLQYLRLNPDSYDSDETVETNFDLHNLHTLEFGAARVNYFYPPWKQLTHVNLEQYYLDVLDVLADSAVEVLRLKCMNDDDLCTLGNSTQKESALYPALHTLWIVGYLEEIQLLVNRIRAPQIRRLSLDEFVYDRTYLTLNFPDLVDYKEIENLEISFRGPNAHNILSQLESMSNIRTLYVLLDVSCMNELSSLLRDSSNILPKLRILRLPGHSTLSYTIDGIVEMLTARQSQPGIGRLDEVQILSRSASTVNTMAVQRLRDSIGAYTKVSELLGRGYAPHFERIPEFRDWD